MRVQSREGRVAWRQFAEWCTKDYISAFFACAQCSKGLQFNALRRTFQVMSLINAFERFALVVVANVKSALATKRR